MADSINTDIKKLGFGLMRLPKKGISIDIEHTSQMVDKFLDAGFTYFDTAHVYPGSEVAIKKALVDRHDRESFTLATKLFATTALTENMAKQQFTTSLERTGAGYIDYYLMHTLMSSNYKKYDKFHLWDFAFEEKAKGRIKHVGFSFHDGPELLDQILTEHPEAEFVQLQINYADWENKNVASRANYEVARKHGKPIVVMEPVKGGSLADPPKAVKDIFDRVNPGASYASWAIRFVASLDGILSVLSGMSNISQMDDNISYMKDFQKLSSEEWAAINEAQMILKSSALIPCTSCKYCIEGCPKQIAIPDCFSAMNKQLGSGQLNEARSDYAAATNGRSKASDCIKCRKCESVCPQHIDIVNQLEGCARVLE